MDAQFQRINLNTLQEKVFDLIGNNWMLITAGNRNDFNMMTASWGSLGMLWHRPVAIIFVRPERYTYQFVEKNDYFTLSFFEEKDRHILQYCGTHSGRNVNKIEKTGLIPLVTVNGNIYYSQARLVFECQKLYADDIKQNQFVLSEVCNNIYSSGDFHRFYFGGVLQCLLKQK